MRIPSEVLFGGGGLNKRQDASPPSSSTPSPSQTPSPTSSSTPSPSPSSSSSGNSGTTKTVAIVLSIAFVLLLVNIGVFFYLRKIRRRNASRHAVPTAWLKDKWHRFNISTRFGSKGSYSPSLQRSELSSTLTPGDDTTTGPDQRSSTNTPNSQRRGTGVNNVETAQRASVASTVGRATSLRSIMTLPAYTPAAAPNERILGREGDRAGIDTVVEFPETADETEDRREEEMESLYQIRLQRRREHAAREDRRRLRREARARGDLAEVNRLRRESRLLAADAAQDPSSAASMMVDHQTRTRGRDRRVSSVSYAGAGVARHDGTRLREHSAESDRSPLLESAAGMGGGQQQHRRERSEASLLTTSSMAIEEEGPRASEDDYEVLTLAPTHTRASSNAPSTAAGSDLGEARIPLVDPPEYEDLGGGWEDAPPYESPIEPRRRSLLPRIERLPAIEVTMSSPAVGNEETEGRTLGREAAEMQQEQTTAQR
ncbi:MAG: hypothetical protein M1822_000799 [Bathelium mastoideum]|nr:MAG: hypothetical protein M1822_000799 [Bathelium mastoideum]